MPSTLRYLSGENFVLNEISGSGLGFYGSSYGSPVAVGEYQDSTYITSSNGTALNAVKVDNCKYIDANTVEIAGNEQILLRELPNYLATLNIRLESDTPIRVQNPKFKIFDRVNVDNNAVGVVTKCALTVHPWNTQSPNGSGSLTWSTVNGSGAVMDFGSISSAAISPGPSGTSVNGALTSASQHDWYVAISCSPTTIGSKTAYGSSFSCEFI